MAYTLAYSYTHPHTHSFILLHTHTHVHLTYSYTDLCRHSNAITHNTLVNAYICTPACIVCYDQSL